MLTTRTGSFPIAFRRGGSEWQKNLSSLIAFARTNDFAGLDVGPLPIAELRQILDAGLQIGSIDMPQPWAGLASADPAKRDETVDKAAAYINEVAALPGGGVRNFFIVVFPEDGTRRRSDNLDLVVEGYGRLCQRIESSRARIVMEGYPGGAPHFPALGCTPADLRLLFERIDSPVMAINFDPSHLIRMSIDPVRFVQEFGERIGHVHAKDTELFADALYEHGNLQPPTVAKSHGFGGVHWRYTLPGHGVAPWTRLFALLAAAGYDGLVSIELEDENFNGSEDGEKRGLLASRDFLAHA